MIGRNVEEGTGGWTKLHNEEFHTIILGSRVSGG
jgi:hypothetical protein